MPKLYTDTSLKSVVLPQNSSLINYSVLNEFYTKKPFRSFSIKYVVEGLELYSVNGTNYNVTDKQYLLANKHSEGFALIDSKKPVTGICIDVSPEILSEVVSNHLAPDTATIDISLDAFFNSTHFLENKYHAQHTHLGQCLLQMEQSIKDTPDIVLNKEFYYTISEQIVKDHIPILKKLQSIKAVKAETKKYLLRNLYKGKEYIDCNFNNKLDIETVSMEAGLSEYHFFRLFKSTFGLSPHQYIIQKRLLYSKHLLETESPSVSIVSVMSGFSDVHSFSKSFKKYFGYSPSKKLV